MPELKIDKIEQPLLLDIEKEFYSLVFLKFAFKFL